jgi:hypothetical protein
VRQEAAIVSKHAELDESPVFLFRGKLGGAPEKAQAAGPVGCPGRAFGCHGSAARNQSWLAAGLVSSASLSVAGVKNRLLCMQAQRFIGPERCKRQSISTLLVASGLAAFLVQPAFPFRARGLCTKLGPVPHLQAIFDVARCWPSLARFSSPHCGRWHCPNEIFCNVADRCGRALSRGAHFSLGGAVFPDGRPLPVGTPKSPTHGADQALPLWIQAAASLSPHRHRAVGPGPAQKRLNAAR